MKKKFRISAILALVFTLVLVSGVLAGSIGNIDGVWQYVQDNPDPNSNAFCVTYGSGNGTSETNRSRNDPAIQAVSTVFENQIHYGKGSGVSGDCPTTNAGVTSTWFDAQSGLGFDGNDNVGTFAINQVFLVGRLTHYNRPIYLTNTWWATPPDWAFMEWIDIDLNVTGLQCTSLDGTGTVDPINGTSETFTYRVNFDETPNACNIDNNPCTYTDYGTCPGSTSGGLCPDAVTISSAPPAQTIECGTNALPEEQGVFTLELQGFVPNSNTTCPATPAGAYSTQYVTQENSTNHACLYGKITGFVPAAVTLKDFSADIVDEEVLISWETLAEVNTLGFNLYRSETQDGEKVLVNPELIMSNLAPGSLGGALYEYLDEANAAEAYYWLEEIEIDGTATSYGWTLALAR